MKKIPLQPHPDFIREIRRLRNKNRHFQWADLQKKPELKKLLYDSKKREHHSKCGYCECPLEDAHLHIDHFRQRRSQPQLQFVWDNLVLSCKSDSHCGVFKDRTQIISDDIFNPYHDNPRMGITFVVEGEDGSSFNSHFRRRNSVAAHPLSEKGSKTIDAFNLNNEKLRFLRRNALYKYESDVNELASLCWSMLEDGCDISPLWEIVSPLLQQMEEEPFASTLIAFAKEKLLPFFPDSWPHES